MGTRMTTSGSKAQPVVKTSKEIPTGAVNKYPYTHWTYIMALYKGFSTFEFEARKTFEINDIELVKLDLLNHIFTRKGSRVMMPTFGTTVPDLLFEPLDEFTTETLEEELRKVIEFDPRVRLLSFDVDINPDQYSVDVHIRLFYIELEVTDNFELNISFEA